MDETKKKGPLCGPFSLLLAERTGLAYMPQAADSLARESLRVPIHAPRRGSIPISQRKKGPLCGPFSLLLAERTGLEPATPDVTGRYSNQLNYHSVFDRYC